MNNDETDVKENTVTEKYLIKENGVEGFKIGEPIPFSAENYKMKKHTEIGEEGWTYFIYTVWENDEEILRLIPLYDTTKEEFTDNIGEINIISDKFRDSRKIGVNSTIQEFTEVYPDYYIWYTYISDIFFIDNKERRNIQYLLDKEEYQGEEIQISGDMEILDKESFEPTARIKEIRIF